MLPQEPPQDIARDPADVIVDTLKLNLRSVIIPLSSTADYHWERAITPILGDEVGQ